MYFVIILIPGNILHYKQHYELNLISFALMKPIYLHFDWIIGFVWTLVSKSRLLAELPRFQARWWGWHW